MNNTLLAVAALSLSLAPLAAKAQPVPPPGTHAAVAVQPRTVVPVRAVRPPPPATVRPGGHYVWRTENVWIPARTEWVQEDAQRCRVNPAGHVKCKTVKHPRTVARTIPGHYEASGRWVWVPYETIPVSRPAPVQARVSLPVGNGQVVVGVNLPLSVDLS